MKTIITTSLLCAVIGAATGCTVAQSAQYATARYCFFPPEVRAANREIVAFTVAPNRINIQCAGDAYVSDAP